MNLRVLSDKDAPFMLEWMHDTSVVENLQANFATKTLEDCKQFILSAHDTSENVHLAIVDDADTYMGTVSLKHICDRRAEFAITIRTCAMGQGYARFAMAEIIRLGFEKLFLDTVYWCVAPENKRAVRFYDKNGYPRVSLGELECALQFYSVDQAKKYIWYAVSRERSV